MKKLKQILQSNYLIYLLLVFIVIYILMFTKLFNYNSKLKDYTNIEGIVKDISITEEKINFTLKGTEKINCVYYLKGKPEYKITDLLGKKVKVNGIPQQLYSNTITNTFNYKEYLYNKNIYLSLNVNSIEILKEENIFYKIKNKIIERIDSFDVKTKTYLNLFILGDDSYLSDNNYQIYKDNGIWHLFAISGMHINLIVLVLSFFLKKIKYRSIIISIFLLYFMFITGFSPSVQRVTIFFYISNLFKYLDIKIANIKILFYTAFIILIINPFMIYHLGFQYSFLISLAIMLESKYITGNYFMKILKISLLSFIVSMPLTININYEINLISIFLNLFYVPFISFIFFPFAIIVVVFPFLECLFEFLIYILEQSNYMFSWINLSLIIPKLSVHIIILYYVFIVFFYYKRKKLYVGIAIIVVFISNLFYLLNNNYFLCFFDVKQGDSNLIVSPFYKSVTLIDTGGAFNSNYHVSDNIMLFLKSFGINKINNLILTHGDYDHMGEAINLVENFKIENVIFNCGSYNELEQDLIKVLDKKKIPYYSCISELNIGKDRLYFLNTKDYNDENENSSVIYTEIDNIKLLFMGDAGVEREKDILKKYNLKTIDILKVGHHGSNTSSSKEFIDSIDPKQCLISVGKNNRYGHPKDSVINALEDYCNIYRTDIKGSVEIKLKNNDYKIKTISP